MSNDMTPAKIKEIRQKYGLTQQSFARVLGLGEASIARYENGQIPTKANANLIRAAENPSFMLDCLERDGELLSAEQRDKAERIVYSMVSFNEEGDIMDINEIYEITLQQEILNEQAAEYLGELARLQLEAQASGDEGLALIYKDARRQIALAKASITDGKHNDKVKLAEVRGTIKAFMAFAYGIEARVA